MIKTIVKVLLSGLAVLLVFRKIEVDEMWLILKSANILWLSLAIVFFVLSKVVTALRLNIYFRNIGLQLSEKMNLLLYLKGMYYNLFLPGGIGGDGYKVYLLNKRHQTPLKKLLQSVLLDRLGGLVTIIFLLLLLFLIIDVEIFQDPTWTILSAILAVLVFPFFYSLHLLIFKAFRDSFLRTNLYSFAGQLLQLFSTYFILKALGIEAHTLEYQFVFLLSSIAAVLPLTIGGVGIRELVFVISHEFIPIEKNAAVVFSLLFFLITAIVSLNGAFVDTGSKKHDI